MLHNSVDKVICLLQKYQIPFYKILTIKVMCLLILWILGKGIIYINLWYAQDISVSN